VGKIVRIEREYYAQAVDPKTKVVKYQAANKSKAELESWFRTHAQSGKFAGLEPHLRERYLFNGRPFHVQQKHWLIIILIIVLILNIAIMWGRL
jgi:hypothetical protein